MGVGCQSANGWRLPNSKELAGLADKACQSTAIDSTAFPVTPASWFWRSSPYVRSSNDAWVVVFLNGYVGRSYTGDSVHVRLVRASQ